MGDVPTTASNNDCCTWKLGNNNDRRIGKLGNNDCRTRKFGNNDCRTRKFGNNDCGTWQYYKS
jgi:hypothetical protein